MNGLADFLLACIAEDEETARAATCRLPGASEWVAGAANADGIRTEAGTPVTKFSWPHEMAHIARWDPARVLAECAAKRAIIDEHRADELLSGPRDPRCRRCFEYPSGHNFAYPCRTIRLLAQPYAGHPDYRADEWGTP